MEAPPIFEQTPPKKKSPVLWILLGVVVLCACPILLILAAILFPVFSQARTAARSTLCLSNMKQTAVAAIMYTSDYDERLPLAPTWQTTLSGSTTAKVLGCPDVKGPIGGFAFVKSLSGKRSDRVGKPNETILLFESNDVSLNAVGDPKEPFTPRHQKQSLGYLDGHARSIRVK